LVQHHAVTHTNLLVSPDYLRLRSTLVAALRPYPAAALAVGRALHALEADAAKDITERATGPRKAPAAPFLIEHEAVEPLVAKARNSGAQDYAPDKRTGKDGKSYPAKAIPPPPY